MIIDLGGTGNNRQGIYTVNSDKSVNPNWCGDIMMFLSLLDASPEIYSGHFDFNLGDISEIRMIHTIEHLPYRDIDDVLSYLYNILNKVFLESENKEIKLAIECPDLKKIAKMILMSDDEFNNYIFSYNRENKKETKEQLILWGLYGYPYQEEMKHEWGYTQETLSELLITTGFKRITFLEPKYHLKARDMRVECYVQ